MFSHQYWSQFVQWSPFFSFLPQPVQVVRFTSQKGWIKNAQARWIWIRPIWTWHSSSHLTAHNFHWDHHDGLHSDYLHVGDINIAPITGISRSGRQELRNTPNHFGEIQSWRPDPHSWSWSSPSPLTGWLSLVCRCRRLSDLLCSPVPRLTPHTVSQGRPASQKKYLYKINFL